MVLRGGEVARALDLAAGGARARFRRRAVAACEDALVPTVYSTTEVSGGRFHLEQSSRARLNASVAEGSARRGVAGEVLTRTSERTRSGKSSASS